MVISCKRNKEKFNSQKVVLAVFFSKRIGFLLITFLISNGSLQSILLSLIYMFSMVVFAFQKPLGSKRTNLLGMLNELLLATIVCHTYYFTGVVDESLKYDVGKSMLVLISMFSALNLVYFIDKGLRHFRVWILLAISPEMVQDLSACLNYLHLKWLLFPQGMSLEERRLQRQ